MAETVEPAPVLAVPTYGFEDLAARFATWLAFLSWTPAGIEAATGPGRPLRRALLSKWLRGEVSPSVTSLARVATCIGLSAREFFDETPWERLCRVLAGNATTAPRSDRAQLRTIRPLQRRDLIASVNRVPTSALPAFTPDLRIVDSLEPASLPMLVQLPIFDAARYPMVRDGRRGATVLAGLRLLDAELRQWSYDAGDRALVEAATEVVDTLTKTEHM